MDKNLQNQTCGYGSKKKRNNFGAPLESFYPNGAKTNTFLTPDVKKCLNIVYGPEDASYTNKSYQPDIQNVLAFGKSNTIKYLRSLK